MSVSARLPVRARLLSACAGVALLAACSSSSSSGSGSVSSAASTPASTSSTAPASSSPASSSTSSTSSSASSSPSSATSTSAGTTGTGNAALSAPALAAAARKALVGATAFHLHGSGLSDGKPMVIDMHYGKTSSDGYVTLNGARVGLRYLQPTVYLRGGTSFWRLISASDSTLTAAQKQALVARLADKWVRVPAGSSGLSELSSIAVRTQFQKQATSDDNPNKYRKGPAKTFGTTRTVSFTDPSDGSTIYVAATGTPFPRQISAPKDHTLFDLTDWNVPFSAPRPPAGQTINLPG